jgi:hypothetical protein
MGLSVLEFRGCILLCWCSFRIYTHSSLLNDMTIMSIDIYDVFDILHTCTVFCSPFSNESVLVLCDAYYIIAWFEPDEHTYFKVSKDLKAGLQVLGLRMCAIEATFINPRTELGLFR